MSILIKDMEMPTGNDELRLIIRSNGQVVISHQTYYEEAEAVPVLPHVWVSAADVVEVRHGQWYLDNGCAYCSECKNSFAPGIRSQALFCPRCGAKMDGGQDDG